MLPTLFLLVTFFFYLVMSSLVAPRQETPADRLKKVMAQRKALEGFETRDLPGAPLPPPEEKVQRVSVKDALKRSLVSAVESATRGSRLSNNLAVQLQRGDWKWKPAEFMIAQVVAAGSGLLVAVLLVPHLWWLLPILGWVTPPFLLKRSIARRQKEFVNQLPDALAIIANAMRSGYSFLQAMDVVSREMPDPISKEFALVLREARVNIPIEEALTHMVQRIPSPDLDLVVTAVLIQRQVGGNLSEVLDRIGGTVKDRIRLQGEVRTLTSQGRLSGWIVSLLPVVLGLGMQAMMPGIMDPLFKHPLGIAMLVVAVIMQGIGIMTIRNLVNMEV